MDKKIKCSIILGAATIAFFAYKNWSKKIKKQIEEQERQENEELETLGISTDKLSEEIDPYEDKNNMVKALAAGCFFNADVDEDLINPIEALNVERLISISQENFMFRGTETTDLVYYFDIPNYLKGGYSAPRLIDYTDTIKNAAEKAWSEIIKYCPRPRCKLVGMIIVSYYDPEDPEYLTSEKVEIDDPTIYEELKSDFAHDGFGLGKLYEGLTKKDLPDSVNTKLYNWIHKKWNTEELIGFKTVRVQLVYRVAFAMENKNGIGINIKTAFETLMMFMNKLEIRKYGNERNKEVKYENVLFCAPSNRYTNRFDLTHYYYRNKNNKLDIDSWNEGDDDN